MYTCQRVYERTDDERKRKQLKNRKIVNRDRERKKVRRASERERKKKREQSERESN